jgi:hypothetical protein
MALKMSTIRRLWLISLSSEDEEAAISGYLTLPVFCISSVEILVLPARDECPNTSPLMSKYDERRGKKVS